MSFEIIGRVGQNYLVHVDRSRGAASALLKHADEVSSRVAESGSNLRRIRTDRLHDLAPLATMASTVAATLSTMI